MATFIMELSSEKNNMFYMLEYFLDGNNCVSDVYHFETKEKLKDDIKNKALKEIEYLRSRSLELQS